MAQNTPNCTNSLQRSVNVAQNFVRNAPLTFTGTNDPAFLIADWVRQFILGPPFAWRWNRQKISVTLSQGTQDYVVNVANKNNGFPLGWIEQATLADATTSPSLTYQLEVKLDIAEETTLNQPRQISAQYDDSNGNITFRFNPPPDKSTYTAIVTYQVAPPIFGSLGDTWAPIPDYLSYLYNQGIVAKAYEYLGDGRFGVAMPLFLRQVVAANQGLDDTQVNIFLGERLIDVRETQAAQTKSQMGRVARGMFQ